MLNIALRILGLVIVIFLSGVSLQYFDVTVGDDISIDMEYSHLFLSGVLFSLFIVFNQTPYLGVGSSLLLLTVLVAVYCLTLLIGISTAGIGSPVSGALGALAIGAIAKYNHKKYQLKIFYYILSGFLASLMGYVSAFILEYKEENLWVSIIILLWQLAVGLLFIYHVEKNEKYKKASTNVKL